MPQLDAMLRALAQRGARELVLAEGARPSFRFPDGDRPVAPMTLNRAQIAALVNELGPGDDVSGRLKSGAPLRFVYRIDGKEFSCTIGSDGGTYAARVRPIAAPASASPPPRAPSTAESEVRPSTTEAAHRFDPAPPREGAPAIEAYLAHMVRIGASDLHLSSGEAPMVRLDGDMARIEGCPPCSPEEAARLIFPIVSSRYKQEFEATNDTDFAYEIPGVSRFRCNVFSDRKGVGAVFRTIPSKIPSVEDLGLPSSLLDLCRLSKGLVLVTGPTGSGKSTTLAALIDHINRTRNDHIITIEDPIEFVHANGTCLVNQREVGTHTKAFRTALRAALRQDPDVVLVGEMRDLETVAIAIETAETGHLVFGTLHTSTAPSTVDRIIDQFPSDQQAQIRVMLSESLKGVVSQTLLKRKQGGRVAALEILIGIPSIANLIREGKTFQIPSLMQTGRKHGMILLNDALIDLVRRDVVEPGEAYYKAVDKIGFASALKASGFEVPGTGPAA